MNPFSSSVFFVPCALAASLLLFQVFQSSGPEGPRDSCIVRLVKEAQRREALDYLDGRTREALRSLEAITSRLIDGEMTLQEALIAYAEVYSQLYFVKNQIAAGLEKPLTEEKAFDHLFRRVKDQLKDDPARDRRVSKRLRKEWQSLQASRNDVP